MRVISQNGKSDIPYEHFAFSIVGNGSGYSIIATRNIAEPPEVAINSVIATYSTEAKAIKAMEMLRKAYIGMPITIYPSKMVFANNDIFQFPQDNEIEA